VIETDGLALPLGSREASEIAWYLDDYAVTPVSTDAGRAKQAEALIRQARQDLQRFLADHGADVHRACQTAPGPVTVEVFTDDAGWLEQPWEMIEQGDLNVALVVRSLTPDEASHRAPSTGAGRGLDVLLVIARPRGGQDVPYHPVGEALYDLFGEAGWFGRVHLARPPTIDGLRHGLAAAKRAGRPYSIVHFDGHGIHETQVGAKMTDPRRVVSRLVFETPRGGPDLMNPQALAAILLENGVRAAVINACRSGAGVGPELARAGLDAVLCMSHNIRASSVPRFVTAFYRSLIAGQSFSAAAAVARRLMADQSDGLADWFVPIAFEADPQRGFLRGLGRSDTPHAPLHTQTFPCRGAGLAALEIAFRHAPRCLLVSPLGYDGPELAESYARWRVVTDPQSTDTVPVVAIEASGARTTVFGSPDNGFRLVDLTAAAPAAAAVAIHALKAGTPASMTLVVTTQLTDAQSSPDWRASWSGEVLRLSPIARDDTLAALKVGLPLEQRDRLSGEERASLAILAHLAAGVHDVILGIQEALSRALPAKVVRAIRDEAHDFARDGWGRLAAAEQEVRSRLHLLPANGHVIFPALAAQGSYVTAHVSAFYVITAAIQAKLRARDPQTLWEMAETSDLIHSIDISGVGPALEALVDAGLAFCDPAGVYTVHPLLRRAAMQDVPPGPDHALCVEAMLLSFANRSVPTCRTTRTVCGGAGCSRARGRRCSPNARSLPSRRDGSRMPRFFQFPSFR
jgi:hypothetical protein